MSAANPKAVCELEIEGTSGNMTDPKTVVATKKESQLTPKSSLKRSLPPGESSPAKAVKFAPIPENGGNNKKRYIPEKHPMVLLAGFRSL